MKQQWDHPALMALSEEELKKVLVRLGLLQDCKLFKCDTHNCTLAWKNGKGRCTKNKCTFTAKERLYSPLHNTMLTYHQYASLAFSYSIGTPPDHARLYAPGLQPTSAGDKKVYDMHKAFRAVTSWATVEAAKDVTFRHHILPCKMQ